MRGEGRGAIALINNNRSEFAKQCDKEQLLSPKHMQILLKIERSYDDGNNTFSSLIWVWRPISNPYQTSFCFPAHANRCLCGQFPLREKFPREPFKFKESLPSVRLLLFPLQLFTLQKEFCVATNSYSFVLRPCVWTFVMVARSLSECSGIDLGQYCRVF